MIVATIFHERWDSANLVASSVSTGKRRALGAPSTEDSPNSCVLQSGEGTGEYASFPSIAHSASGHTYAVWRDAAGHQAAGGHIAFAEMSDPEQRCGWNSPYAIATETNANYTINPAGIVATRGGTLVVGVVRYRVQSPTSARDFRSYALRSHDDGKNWDALQPVDAGFSGQSYPASIVLMPDGSLLMALYGNDDSQSYKGWYVRFSRSTDDGAHWSPWGSEVKDVNHPWNEPQLLVDGNKLRLALRYDAPQGSQEPTGAFLADSSDGGKTWSRPRRVTSGTSGMPTLGKLPDGRYTLAYRDLRLSGSPFRYAVSSDLTTWSEGFDVTGGSARRMLYAGFATVDAHRTCLIYSLENPAGDPNDWAGVYATFIS